MTRSVLAVMGLISVLLLPGCGLEYYYPTAQNVAVIKEKGDIYLSGVLNGDVNGVAAGYAFTDHIGVIGNFSVFGQQSGEAYKNQAYLWEPEFVLFTRWKDKGERKSNMFSSLNVAYGHGELARNQDYFSLALNRFSMQPGIGFSNAYFDVALSARIAVVDHKFTQLRPFDLDPNQTLRQYYYLDDVGEKSFGFFEPAFTFGVGYKYVKLRTQIVYAHPMSDGISRYIDTTIYLTLNILLNTKDFRRKTPN